jgi:hypothetical protein
MTAPRISPRRGEQAAVAGALTLVRAGYGAALLCAPGALIRLTAGPGAAAGRRRRPAEADAQREAAPASRARLVARVLGARHLAQAALTAAGQRADPGSPLPMGGGAAVDLLHAASMLALGTMDRRVRRTTFTDAAVETALAAAGAWAALTT